MEYSGPPELPPYMLRYVVHRALTMRLSDAGLRRRPTKLIYPDHRSLLGPPKMRPATARTDCEARGGSGFSDRGVSGYLSGQYSNRRADIHEKAKT
jgi:hypothetical protein